MKFLMFGAGAIGTYIGGSLALGGESVVFLEQEDAAQIIAGRGMHLQMQGKDYQLDHPVVVSRIASALEYGPFDLAIFALKSFDTVPALEALKSVIHRLPPFLCLQNGVENEAVISSHLGDGKVLAGTVTSSIGRKNVGDILLERRRGIGITGNHALSEKLAAAMNNAGLNAHLYSKPDDMKWSKMLTNLVGNATSAILDMTPASIFAHPGLYRLEIEQLRECLQVMAAMGISVVDLPATPVRALAFAARRLPLLLSRPILQKAVGGGRGSKMPSFHIDLHSGRRKSEVDYLNGSIVRFGAKVGIETPVNRVLNENLLALTNGFYTKEEFAQDPGKLLKLISLR